ncbi:HNH endonuclease [Deinococcus cellulosilyticus]|uniref:HNH endonuclease n=1 Tax=Deinococcus cellulosilyticus TaxID=401558 RepID=UPI0011BD8ABC|nr:HNH endonuclease [Deinococcus cellulosilyticus]
MPIPFHDSENNPSDLDNIYSKQCRRCQEEKSLNEFSPNKKRRDGRQSYCRKCTREYMNKKNHENLEQTRQKHREYYQKNSDSRRASAKRYADSNREQIRFKAKTKRSENLELFRSQERIRYWKCPEKHRMAKLAYWHNNESTRLARQRNRQRPEIKAKGRQAIKQWRLRNPHIVKRQTQNRRALLLKANGFFSNQDVISIYNQQNGLCLYCYKELHGKYSLDHKIPLSRGGTNWPSNLACTCMLCNYSKGNKTPEEYILYRQSLKEESHEAKP